MHVIREVAIATQAIQLHIHSDRARVYRKISVDRTRTYLRILGPVRVHAYTYISHVNLRREYKLAKLPFLYSAR